MVNPAADIAPEQLERAALKFEQPLSERMRSFLRIEMLYRQAQFHRRDPSDCAARGAISGLLEILTILGRGDLRADVLKELDRHNELLLHYGRSPGVDVVRLDGLVKRIRERRQQLGGLGKQFLAPLKENVFLNTVKHRSTIPGGTCAFDIPDYGYWLHLPYEERAAQLDRCFEPIGPICEAITDVLWLTREAAEPEPRIAAAGLYQHNLDRGQALNLVRVILPSDNGFFPEISAGPQRFTVRFVEWLGMDRRPRQAHGDVEFLLALC